MNQENYIDKKNNRCLVAVPGGSGSTDLTMVTSDGVDLLNMEIDRTQAIQMALTILRNAGLDMDIVKTAVNESANANIFMYGCYVNGKVSFRGRVLIGKGVVYGSLYEHVDGTRCIIEDRGEGFDYAVPVIPESVVCLSHKIIKL